MIIENKIEGIFINPGEQMSFFNQFPRDIQREVLYFLQREELQKVDSIVLKNENDIFWRERISKNYTLSLKDIHDLFYQNITSKEIYLKNKDYARYIPLSNWGWKSFDIVMENPELIDVQDTHGSTPLMMHMYPTVIDIEKIKKLVEMGANLNLQNKTGETVLMWESNYEIFKYLLEAGADPNISNNQGYTPLIKHVWREGYAELLIKFGANINHQAVNGITALMTSLKPKLMLRHTIPSKSPREFLIKAGANVNLQDNEGKTALMFAIRRNNFDLVEQLIHAGADVNIRDIYGRSSMDYLQAAH